MKTECKSGPAEKLAAGRPLVEVFAEEERALNRARLAGIAVELWAIQRQMVRGCGNHGCRIASPAFMGTNAPCRCAARDFARRLRDISDRLEAEQPQDKNQNQEHQEQPP